VLKYGLGKGLVDGLSVTWENFVNTYLGRGNKLITIEYPEERMEHAERFRCFPFLLYDGDDPEKGIRCTACGMCARECPPKCITVERDRGDDGKPVSRPKIFEVDMTICMSCGMCAEICPFDAIQMDHFFERSKYTREELIATKKDLLKSFAYFKEICPEMAREDEEARKAKEEKKRKAAEAKKAKAAAKKADDEDGIEASASSSD
jgi:NADH-quinone oxidoreductase subunit I